MITASTVLPAPGYAEETVPAIELSTLGDAEAADETDAAQAVPQEQEETPLREESLDSDQRSDASDEIAEAEPEFITAGVDGETELVPQEHALLMRTLNESIATPEDTLMTELWIGTINPDNTYTYDSGELISPIVSFHISGATASYPGAQLVLIVPNPQYIEKPAFTDLDSRWPGTMQISEADGNYVVTYTFDNLTGGSAIGLPYPFHFKNFVTPNNTISVHKAELRTADGILLKSAEATFTARSYAGLKVEKKVESNNKAVTQAEIPLDLKGATVTPERTLVTYRFDVTYTPPQNVTHTTGAYIPESITIVDKLPEGATMETGGLNARNGWVYDARTHTESATVPISATGNPNQKIVDVPLELNLGNQPVNQPIANHADFVADYGDGATVRIGDDVEATLVFRDKAIAQAADQFWKDAWVADTRYNERPNAYAWWADKLVGGEPIYGNQYGLLYRIFAQDKVNEQTMTVLSIADHDMDPRLYYKAVMLEVPGKARSRVNEVGNVLYGIAADGTRTVIRTNLKAGEEVHQKYFKAEKYDIVSINDELQQYVRLELVFNQPIVLNDEKLVLHVLAYPTAAEMERFKNGIYTKTQEYANSATVALQNGATMTDEDSAEIQIASNPSLKVAHQSNIEIAHQNLNATELTTSVTLNDNFYGYNHPVDAQSIVVIPLGFEYQGSDHPAESTQIVENFRGLGRTAVIFNKTLTPGSTLAADTVLNVHYTLRATDYAYPGLTAVENYYTWTDNKTIDTENLAYIDALDLDEDGDTSEGFAHGTYWINYQTPRYIMSRKLISIDGKNWSLVASPQDPGSYVQYQLSYYNYSVKPMLSVSMLEVLPYQGDRVIVANENGVYGARNSDFAVNMIGAPTIVRINHANSGIEMPTTGFDIYVSALQQGQTLESVLNQSWQKADAATDWSRVTQMKLVLKEGAQIAQEEEIRIYFTAQLPTETQVDAAQVANNTFAITGETGTYIESNVVTASLKPGEAATPNPPVTPPETLPEEAEPAENPPMVEPETPVDETPQTPPATLPEETVSEENPPTTEPETSVTEPEGNIPKTPPEETVIEPTVPLTPPQGPGIPVAPSAQTTESPLDEVLIDDHDSPLAGLDGKTVKAETASEEVIGIYEVPKTGIGEEASMLPILLAGLALLIFQIGKSSKRASNR